MKMLILSCGAVKADRATTAHKLYTGPLFRASWRYAQAWQQRHAGTVAILSARHGLMDPNTVLEPYEQRLTTSRKATLAEVVGEQLWRRWSARDLSVIEVHAGAAYVAVLQAAMVRSEVEAQLIEPLHGLQIGQRLRWYKRRRGAA